MTLDADGYPTEDTLAKIRDWEPTDFHGLAEYIAETWEYPDRASLGGDTLWLSTGGWSGNEEIIASIPQIWHSLFFYLHKRGGYYEFRKNPCAEGEK